MKFSEMKERIKSVSALTCLKAGITMVACFLIFLRIFLPELKVDSITLALLVVAVLPWLSSLIESAKFPGGWEVRFRDLQAAGNEIIETAPPATTAPTTAPPDDETKPSYLKIVGEDPNLALVGLRIEIETRMRKLAEAYDIPENLPLSRILSRLRSQNIVLRGLENALYQLIRAGNRAAHGARVEEDAAFWAIDVGPEILNALDRIIEERRTSASAVPLEGVPSSGS